MSQFLTKYNSDDIFFRAVIVGLLNFMTNKIQIWNVENGITVEYPVPFYYNASGDERFMQDIFQQHSLDDCIDPKVVEANTDIIPRGHITLAGITVVSSSLTNRFIRGKYIKETADEIITYNAPMNMVPLELSFTCEIRIDTSAMAFKMVQRVIETFYKVHAFAFMWQGMSLQAGVAFPEDQGLENVYEFGFGDNTDSKINFTIAVETYMPVIDKTQEFRQSNSIENFGLEVNMGPVYWPDKGLDGENVNREPIQPPQSIVTTNAEYIPEEQSDAARVTQWEQLYPDKKTTEDGQDMDTTPSTPGSIPIYSIKDLIPPEDK